MSNLKKFQEEISDKMKFNSDITFNSVISKFALENSNIGVWDYSVLNNTVNYSKEAKEILELDQSSDSSCTFNWQEAIHPDDLVLVLKKLKLHFDNRTPNYISEHRIITKKGTYKWIKDIGTVVTRDENGNHTRIIGTIIDIDKRKRQEANINNKQGIIKKQNEKLKNFAFIATHNLKSHAANFESLLNFHDETEDYNEQKEIIEHLKTVSKALTKTIKSLNKIVTTESSKNDNLQTININKFINECIDTLDVKIKKCKATIQTNIPSDLRLEQNPAYFESVLQNLILNAIKYRHRDRDPIINIQSKVTKEHIILTFKDNGLGIDLDKYGNDIFGLYKTFHNNENAEGVGLYLTKNQIEAFGGSIEVESQVDIGSTFTIKYPNKKSLV